MFKITISNIIGSDRISGMDDGAKFPSVRKPIDLKEKTVFRLYRFCRKSATPSATLAASPGILT